MIFQRSIAGSCYKFPGIERVSQATSCSMHRHTLTYPVRLRSDEFQALRGCKTYHVHPCWFRSSRGRGFRNLPPTQTPSLTPQQSSCLTTTETENGTEGRITGSKTIIHRGTTLPGEVPVVGMTTTTQRRNEGNTTLGSVSLRNIFRHLFQAYLFPGLRRPEGIRRLWQRILKAQRPGTRGRGGLQQKEACTQ